jgi:hypothetical protein
VKKLALNGWTWWELWRKAMAESKGKYQKITKYRYQDN